MQGLWILKTLLKNLQSKGFEHEEAFLEHLIKEGKNVLEIDSNDKSNRQTQTRQAMRNGADIIVQAYLELNEFGGIADFLVKVPGESNLGDYHYEVWDAKLSKNETLLLIQLCCYAEMLESEQGCKPKNVAIVHGDRKVSRLKCRDFFNYYSGLKSNFIFQNNWKIDNQL